MLAVIAAFKFFKAVLLIVIATALFHIRDADAAVRAAAWLRTLPLAAGHHLIARPLRSLLGMDAHTAALFGGVASAYAVLFSIEGIGLWRNADWAKYLTVIATGLAIPVELWEIFVHFTALKVLAAAINIAIVIYLVWLLRATAAHPELEPADPHA